MEFRQYVKLVREKSKLSQEDLARALDVSFATINRWENGKTIPNKMTQKVFFDYCRAQGMDVDMNNSK